MIDTCSNPGVQLRESGGETDHVHLFVQNPPNIAVTTPVNPLNGVSSRKLRQQYPD